MLIVPCDWYFCVGDGYNSLCSLLPYKEQAVETPKGYASSVSFFIKY